MWKFQGLAAFYKKNFANDADNDREMHITPQIAKVVARLPGDLFVPFPVKTMAHRPHQFAYSRVFSLLAIFQWFRSLSNGRGTVFGRSGVSGACDRVPTSSILSTVAMIVSHPVVLEVIRD